MCGHFNETEGVFVMARSRRRGGDTAAMIREAVGGIFSCGTFSASSFPLPSAEGTQLSLTGAATAYGNSGSLDEQLLREALSRYATLSRTGHACLEGYASRRRFTFLCGGIDRSVAIAACISELAAHGIVKLVIAADDNKERDNLYEALSMMRAELAEAYVTLFDPSDDSSVGMGLSGSDNERSMRVTDLVTAYLTADQPSVLLMSQPSFTRGCNLLRRGGELSPSSCIARARPIVLTSSETVESARSMARSTAIFSPIATLCFVGEVRTLRDAVLFAPQNRTTFTKKTVASGADELKQLGL